MIIISADLEIIGSLALCIRDGFHVGALTPLFFLIFIITIYPIRLLKTNSNFSMLFRKYGLDDNTVDFIGHALALHRDDRYLNEPALDTVKRMKVIAC